MGFISWDQALQESLAQTDYCKKCAKKDVCKHIETFNKVVAECNEVINKLINN